MGIASLYASYGLRAADQSRPQLSILRTKPDMFSTERVRNSTHQCAPPAKRSCID
jgi:hypothetical protein